MLKNKIVLPDNINYIPIFLTLRCYSCFYCINGRKGNLVEIRSELDSKNWISFLNGLDISDTIPITLSGGEPTLYKEFYELMEGLEHPIDLLTNLDFDVKEFITKVDPESLFHSSISSYKSIRISFHPQFTKIEELIEKSVLLQQYGFNVGIFPINSPENTEDNMKLAEECRTSQIYFFIKDYLGYYKDNLFGHFKYRGAVTGKKNDSVLCKTNELIIGPEGDVFKCHRDLYLNENPVGFILDKNFKIETYYRDCDNYGTCNFCDIKEKTNRFLEMGSCSVNIIKGKDKIASWDN